MKAALDPRTYYLRQIKTGWAVKVRDHANIVGIGQTAELAVYDWRTKHAKAIIANGGVCELCALPKQRAQVDPEILDARNNHGQG